MNVWLRLPVWLLSSSGRPMEPVFEVLTCSAVPQLCRERLSRVFLSLPIPVARDLDGFGPVPAPERRHPHGSEPRTRYRLKPVRLRARKFGEFDFWALEPRGVEGTGLPNHSVDDDRRVARRADASSAYPRRSGQHEQN